MYATESVWTKLGKVWIRITDHFDTSRMELALVGLAASAASTVALNGWIKSRNPRLVDAPALNDLVHNIFPAIPIWVPDVLLVLSFVLFCTENVAGKEDRLVALGLAFLGRAITIHLTLLPTPVPRDAYCYGHDLWVSGHTLFFCAFASATPVIALMGSFSLVVARQHYTIDVIGAALLYNAALHGTLAQQAN